MELMPLRGTGFFRLGWETRLRSSFARLALEWCDAEEACHASTPSYRLASFATEP